MLGSFFPADRLESYRTSPYKSRIDQVGQRLVAQRYHPEVTAQHLREWLRVTRYLQEQELGLPLDLHAPVVAQYVARRVIGLSASRTRFVWASVRIFLEADERGHCRRRVGGMPPPVPSWFVSALGPYTTFLHVHRGLAAQTVSKRAWQLTHFATSVAHDGVTQLAAIAPRHIQDFLVQLRAQAVATRLTYATTLRSFFRWAAVAGQLPRDLSAAVAAPRQFKQRGLRDGLTDTEVTRILAGVDRSSAIGRRDYAVLLLAARYGLRPCDLRPCDLRQLRLDAVQWREGVLSITQAKTGRVLTLPLLPDVADALIAYLRAGRPATSSRYVFVRHKAPFEPFVAANNLASIMRQALRRVGLDQRSGRRGLYLFRHTLASRLLAAGCSLKRIGDLLGHASTEATMEYASVDLTALRRVTISEAGVRA